MPKFSDFTISDLELDRENPRLPSRLKGAEERDILEYLALKTNIEDLITSIGENDFFPGEAIVVTRSASESGKYVVLEGNRRLTALKLLQDVDLAKAISNSIADAVSRAKHRPTVVPAYEVNSRNDVLQYLGFRHVSGVQRWEPLAKARYLRLLYQTAEGTPESRYGQIAGEIGSRRDTVRKNLDALAAYEVIVESNFFNIPRLDEESFRFGVFYTALANPKIATFTGARDYNDRPTHPIENPHVLKTGEISELTKWMFEIHDDGHTLLGDSRNIPMLAEVVASPAALQLLRSGATLDVARRETPDIQNEFIRNINIARYYVESAKLSVSSVEGNDPKVQQAISELESVLRATVDALFLNNQDSKPGDENVGA